MSTLLWFLLHFSTHHLSIVPGYFRAYIFTRFLIDKSQYFSTSELLFLTVPATSIDVTGIKTSNYLYISLSSNSNKNVNHH